MPAFRENFILLECSFLSTLEGFEMVHQEFFNVRIVCIRTFHVEDVVC